MRQSLLAFLVLGACGLARSRAAAPDDKAKDHLLFMGVDVSIQQNGRLYPLVGVSHGSFLVEKDGRTAEVSFDRGPISIEMNETLKLTSSTAVVAGLKEEKSYTPQNDPTRKFEESLAQSEMLNMTFEEGKENAEMEQDGAQQVLTSAKATGGMSGSMATGPFAMTAGEIQVFQQEVQRATLQTSNFRGAANSAMTSDQTSPDDLFDALEITFQVSAPRQSRLWYHPYAVAIVAYHDPKDKPGEVRNWICAKGIDRIGRDPKTIRIVQGGFPVGFEVKSFQLHLYDRGQEIGSNVAPRRVALTREEAFEYVLFDYLGSHKHATLPATPALADLPPDLPSRLGPGQFRETFFVKVSKDGRPTGVYLDPNCSQAADDAYLQSVVDRIRFKPALKDGQAVDGVATLRLDQVPI